ncbi:inhibin beta B chain-like [Lethenteron reissneri]|uniref:inhibin beta B chain-like n=1 Tax=Lethenteron reissneri TaxID=7753 RepID=UPI002AB6311A|nr:inhibin beta B chain-like [Lethenteron reissneri]
MPSTIHRCSQLCTLRTAVQSARSLAERHFVQSTQADMRAVSIHVCAAGLPLGLLLLLPLATTLAEGSPVAAPSHPARFWLGRETHARHHEGDRSKSSGEARHRKAECAACATASLHLSDSEQGEQLLVEAVKRHILDKLGLKERPNITHPVPRSALLAALNGLRLQEENWDERRNEGDRAAHDSSEIISFAEFDGGHSSEIHFALSKSGEQRPPVLRADLWLYVHTGNGGASGASGNGTATFHVRERHGAGTAAVQRRVAVSSRSHWTTFPLTKAVQAALSRGAAGLSVRVTCDGCQGAGGVRATLGPRWGDSPDSDYRPFLLLHLGSDAAHRVSRRDLQCDDRSDLCCLHRFFVDFHKIGWNDWIIQPSGYQSNFCLGKCPLYMAGTPGASASFHNAIINQYRLRGVEPMASKNPCCVPTRLTSMSMLYLDKQNNIIKKDVPDMVVEECGCA